MQRLFSAVGVHDGHGLGGRVDVPGDVFEPERDAMRFDVGRLAVGEVVPVRGLAAEEEREPADAVVRVRIRDHDGHLARGVELPGPQRGADARVAATDDQYLGHVLSPFGAGAVRHWERSKLDRV